MEQFNGPRRTDRPNSVSGRPVSGRVRGVPPSNVRPSNMRMDKAGYRAALVAYYSKFAPTLNFADIDLAVEAYGFDANSRAAFDRELQGLYGIGLDEYYLQHGSSPVRNNDEDLVTVVINDTETMAPARPPKAVGRVPSVRLVGDPVQNLKTALANRNVPNAYDILADNGITSLVELGNLPSSMITVIFPHGPELSAVQAVYAAAQKVKNLENGDEPQDNDDDSENNVRYPFEP